MKTETQPRPTNLNDPFLHPLPLHRAPHSLLTKGRFRIAGWILLLLIAAAGRIGAATVQVEVGISGMSFDPSIVDIKVGDTVEWVWSTQFFHTVSSGANGTSDGLFESGSRNGPSTFSYTFQNAGTFHYYCKPHYSMGMTGTVNVTAGPVPSPTPGLVANVSTRLPVGTDDNVLIEGFIVQGPAGSTKKIMVRAIGPSLAPFGITDALANPTLDIFDGSNVKVATNNNWKTTEQGGLITSDQFAEINGSGLAPSNDLESAIIANLAPGSYTAVVRGLGNTTGTGVVDAYDMSAASAAKLANIATRGLIQPGDKLMIAGFIVQNGSVRAVVRAIGPSLTAFGVANALQDTTLQLRDQNGMVVRENDNWQSDPSQKAELESTGLQPSDTREAAVIASIPPGQYTAQVRGKPETTGIGVVQIYFLQ